MPNAEWRAYKSTTLSNIFRMTHASGQGSANRSLSLFLAMLVVIYATAVSFGWPQEGTRIVVEGVSEHHEDSLATDDHSGSALSHDSGTASDGDGHHKITIEQLPPPWVGIPFVLLLGAIAVFPLVGRVEHWWESNLHRFYIAAGLGVATLAYFLVLHGHPVDGHWPAHHVIQPSQTGLNWGLVGGLLENAVLSEYIPFIVLLFSLYTIAGGIRIQGDLRAHPLTNTVFLAIGGLLASFLGTTGAAMLLIRPLLETNAERTRVRHTVVFFIFIVCNCGGCLLPIGDPPLFLGYLKGVPFTWTLGLWHPWLIVNGLLLTLYFLMDHFIHYPREPKGAIASDETQTRRLSIRGLAINGPLLLGVVLSVALLDPGKVVPGTDWHPWLYLREIVQFVLVGLSLRIGCETVRSDNKFNFHAIVEVAALFIGIFICMQPVLQILNVRGHEMGIDTPLKYFWITGGLSSVLDNAPTYLVFFETAKVSEGTDLVAGVAVANLVAISLGAVFMGAMTYIGNGPNFMVKAIAEKSGVRMPSFFGYMLYSFVFLLPILFVATWVCL